MWSSDGICLSCIIKRISATQGIRDGARQFCDTGREVTTVERTTLRPHRPDVDASTDSQADVVNAGAIRYDGAESYAAPLGREETKRFDVGGTPAIVPPQVHTLVAGVGGAGTNALNHIGHVHDDAVRLIALNTDAQTLAQTQADDHLCLGEAITQGLGAGGSPETGERAAEASRHHIASLLRGGDLVFVIAGLGGGTGTGAAPTVARVAREQGALTVGMVTLPFAFEGARRRQIAYAGLARMAQAVDALIVIPNDRLIQVANQGQTLNDAFVQANAALRQAIVGVVEIVAVPGLINVDFADARAVLRQAGPSLLAVGEASGADRATHAVEDAMSGGWLDADIRGARRVLLNITGSANLSLSEVTEVASRVSQRIDPQADCVFGAVIDPSLTDTLRVTLIAAGLPRPE
jgi:cell division protein FtsZ